MGKGVNEEVGLGWVGSRAPPVAATHGPRRRTGTARLGSAVPAVRPQRLPDDVVPVRVSARALAGGGTLAHVRARSTIGWCLGCACPVLRAPMGALRWADR